MFNRSVIRSAAGDDLKKSNNTTIRGGGKESLSLISETENSTQRQ